VRLGITDGPWTELRGGSLEAGDELVTSIVVPSGARLR
jgi:hypothetical protein